MNVHRKKHPGSMLLLIVILGALLGACGAEQPTGTTVGTKPSDVTVGTPAAGLTTCMACHPVTTADWLKTRHANMESSPSYTTGAGCAVCHDKQGDGQFLSPARMVTGCEACHSGGGMHVAAGGSGPIGVSALYASALGSVRVSAQFNTCTACHELLNSSGTGTALTLTPSWHSSDRRITDTHYTTSGDWSGSGGVSVKDITGYAMDYSSETVCTDCHNPHGTADINREWALSAHGDKSALATDYWSGAWAHYNWSLASRTACQRCHTTTGFAAYMNALRNGDAALATLINAGTASPPPMASSTAYKPEVLKCNGCHIDNKGTLRNPGAITTNYDYVSGTPAKTYALASYTYPDVNGSNVCMACHTGREAGETLMALNDPILLSAGTISATDYSNLSFINSHYLTAGGTVFTATGFEFAERSYENSSSYRHVDIGSAAVPNSGNNGPCVGCHMSRSSGNGDHLFMPVARSTTSIGHIDSVASEVCIYCHTVSGAGGLEELINERKEEYIEAIEATMYVLDKRGFYFRGAHPYFYQVRTASTTTIKATATNLSTDVTGSGTLWVTGPSGTVTGGGSSPDYFKVDSDGTYYKIVSVVSDTQLILETAYDGSTAVGAEFSIIKSGTANGIKNWMTKAGTGITAATSTDTDITGTSTGKNNLGAAFNLNLLEHDPGAYVHNRMYAKRLLYDAIDWADDNRMNNSVGTTLTTKLPAGAIYRAGAIKYLLPYGVLGIAAERP